MADLIGPTAVDDAVTTAFGTPVVFNPLDNDIAGDAPLDPAGTLLFDGLTYSNTVSTVGGVFSIDGTSNITLTPADGWNGRTSSVYRVTDTNGLTSDATITVTVEAEVVVEPPRPIDPIVPLNNVKWVLGSFQTGIYEDLNLPYIDDDIANDITSDDEGQVVIPLFGLSEDDALNWKTKFELNEKYAACIADDGRVLSYGYLEKLSIDTKAETITLKLGSFKKYLDSRFVTRGSDSINKSDTVWTVTGDARTVVKQFVMDSLAQPGSPTNIIYPASRTGSYSYPITLSELTPVSEHIKNIAEDPAGVEIRFIPKTENNRIVVELVGGDPYINDDSSTVYNIDISSVEADNFLAGISAVEDGADTFNKVWLQSEGTSTTATTDINLSARKSLGGKVLRETKEKFSVPLTQGELDAQYNARLSDVNKPKKDITISVWDDDLSLAWSSGRRINLTSTTGATRGLSAVVRIVAVKVKTKARTVDLTVSEIRSVYPALPKNLGAAIQDNASKDFDNKLKWDSAFSGNSFGTGSEANPWNPGEGTGGDFSNGDLWGDEGKPADGSAPFGIDDAIFTSFSSTTVYPSVTDGFAMVGPSITQGDGNRIYGLNQIGYNFSWYEDEGFGAKTLDPATGKPFGGWPSFLIRSSFLQNGQIGDITNVGEVDGALIDSIVDNWEPPTVPPPTANSGNRQMYYKRALLASMYVVGNRAYFLLADSYGWIFSDTGVGVNEGGGKVKTYLISSAITSSGTFSAGTWVVDTAPPNNAFIYPYLTSKYGNKIVTGAALTLPSDPYNPSSYFGNLSMVYPHSTDQPGFKNAPLNYVRANNVGATWLTFPSNNFSEALTSSDPTRPFYPVVYNGWLYGAPVGTAFQWQTGGVWRIRVTADGTVPPDAIWVKCFDLPTQTSYYASQALIVARGNLCYVKEDGFTVYRKINPDGSTGAEKAMSGSMATFINGNTPYNSNYRPLPYGTPPNRDNGYDNTSRYLSYGGYVYEITNTFNPAGLNVRSMKIIEA
jgi:hypothetical protein